MTNKQLTIFDQVDTLQLAKDFIQENRHEGCICPACEQFVKLYKRILNSGMAMTLIRLYQYNGAKTIHVKKFLKEHKLQNNHDWTLLRHWGLIAPHQEFTTKEKSGYWRITPLGIRYIYNNVALPKYILMYNNKFIDFEGPDITIKTALKQHFDYAELMNYL